MMTVVFPLTTQIDHTELKFSLRSIEKYLQPPFEVVVVGDHMPDWLNNVTQIQLGDVRGKSNYSVRRKVVAALHLSREIFFMNDDFYLLQPTNPKKFPYYTSGALHTKGEAGAKQLMHQLNRYGKPSKYFGHYPAVYRSDFSEVIKYFTPECMTKSAYCNFIEVDSVEITDCKIMSAKKPGYVKEFIKDKPCFSTGAHSITSALPVLQELFPEPSFYEI